MKSEKHAALLFLFFLSMWRVDVKLLSCVFKVAVSGSRPCEQARFG